MIHFRIDVLLFTAAWGYWLTKIEAISLVANVLAGAVLTVDAVLVVVLLETIQAHKHVAKYVRLVHDAPDRQVLDTMREAGITIKDVDKTRQSGVKNATALDRPSGTVFKYMTLAACVAMYVNGWTTMLIGSVSVIVLSCIISAQGHFIAMGACSIINRIREAGKNTEGQTDETERS